MEELVHVIPLGWEHDRAVFPVQEALAHRVHLLVRFDHPFANHFYDEVAHSLEAEKIEVEPVEVDPSREFESTLLNVARIIRDESQRGNRVYINMSASGKVAAAAASIAAMYHAKHLGGMYYASPEDYLVGFDDEEAADKGLFMTHGLTRGLSNVKELPVFELKRVSRAGEVTLALLYEKGELPQLELVSSLKDEGVEPFGSADITIEDPDYQERRENQNVLAQFRRRVLSELLDDGLVEKAHRGIGGKLHLSLTANGRHFALASGRVSELR